MEVWAVWGRNPAIKEDRAKAGHESLEIRVSTKPGNAGGKTGALILQHCKKRMPWGVMTSEVRHSLSRLELYNGWDPTGLPQPG